MKNIGRIIFRAVSEKKWISIEYFNRSEETTRYWIAVKEIDVKNATICVDGFHVFNHQIAEFILSIERIKNANIIEGSYYENGDELKSDINENPEKYKSLFGDTANLQILDYLAECNKLDSTPYKSDYTLVSKLDDSKIVNTAVELTDEQFSEIVVDFQNKVTRSRRNNSWKMEELGMNKLSLHTRNGLYVLAYKPLRLDVRHRRLVASEGTTICMEYALSGIKQSIRNFLDEPDFYLLDNFDANAEKIKDIICDNNPGLSVDDMPYIIAMGRDFLVDLHSEYNGIVNLYTTEEDSELIQPIRAFFGDLTVQSRKRKSCPFALTDKMINLDQLLAMNNAMRAPVAYIQGPPGTGKTQTIVKTIITAYFNDKTVLFSSYNNHPIDGVIEKLKSIKYHNKPIPFPVARLGNNDEIAKTLTELKDLYDSIQNVSVYPGTLEKNKKQRSQQATRLTKFLENYEELLDLQERRETIELLTSRTDSFNFQTSLQANQLNAINSKIKEIGDIRLEEALSIVDNDTDELLKYLYYTSIGKIQKLSSEIYAQFRSILSIEDPDEKVREFNRYISNEDNLISFMQVFPIIATTCISAQKIGEPKPVFDMVIIDEASQCNTAVSLVPIIRGKNLMLVGDPQQLSPVVLLSETDNEILKKKYHVSDDYDYLKNSLYKTFLAADAVNDEVLLRTHYRCNKKIIDFNNHKYYNDKLLISSVSKEEEPLVFVDVSNDLSQEKNVAPEEITEIRRIINDHPNREIGIITPFVKQKNAINEMLEQEGIKNIECGTVHAFQGDEKDIIIFSLALTDFTRPETYNWLKNNRELINVATSRAQNKLIIIGSMEALNRLHEDDKDDIYELVNYVKTNGKSEVTKKLVNSRALGIRPFSSQTEDAFLSTLNHALENAFNDGSRYVVHKEVSISQVFLNNPSYSDFFYKGRFDFVVYQKSRTNEMPILAIELDGKEHHENDYIKRRDMKKEQICREHGFELIRVENSYARRYHYIKDILTSYFTGR